MGTHSNIFIFKDIDGCKLYIRVYNALWQKIYLEEIKNKHEAKVHGKRSLWTFLKKKAEINAELNFVERNFSVDALHFHKIYRLAVTAKKAKEEDETVKSEVGINREVLIAVFDYLRVKEASTLSERLKLFEVKYPQESDEDTDSDEEGIIKNSKKKLSFSKLLGISGNKDVTILIKIFQPKSGDDVTLPSEHDIDAKTRIENLLNIEHVFPQIERHYANDQEIKDDVIKLDPQKNHSVFCVIGFYPYNFLPISYKGDKIFVEALLFSWLHSFNGEYLSILFNNKEYTVHYDDKSDTKNCSGMSHSVLAKIKFSTHTVIICAGVGERATGILGKYLEKSWQSIYDKYGNIDQFHSYAILFKVDLLDYTNTEFVDFIHT